MNVADALDGVERLFLDTAPVIYFLERNPKYFSRMESFFRIRRQKGILLVTSPVTLAECLVHPLKQGLTELAQTYRQVIVDDAGAEYHHICPHSAERAARLRATVSISLMDALQVGVALSAGCQAFFTNDRHLSRISDLPVILLEDLEH